MRCSYSVLVSLASLALIACPSSGSDDGTFTSTGLTEVGDGDGDPTTDESSDESSSDTEVDEECGNGTVENGEECDLGSQNSDAGNCTTQCTIAECGDGFVYDGFEECDDGNSVDTDACVAACKLATCGDGYTQEGVEVCDDGNDDPADGCTPTCMPGACGDGVIQDGEQCDDGNRDLTDECPACQLAFCGDGFMQAGVEVCDDGNQLDNDGCLPTFCTPAECGDGFVYEGMEECDDGNDVDEDGCDNQCVSNSTCLNNPLWMPVDCVTDQWVWSSDSINATTLEQANAQQVLWTGCSHSGVATTCSLDGTGWVSTQTFVMNGCDQSWYHIGGSYTGACGGHDGDQVRRLALGDNGCYSY